MTPPLPSLKLNTPPLCHPHPLPHPSHPTTPLKTAFKMNTIIPCVLLVLRRLSQTFILHSFLVYPSPSFQALLDRQVVQHCHPHYPFCVNIPPLDEHNLQHSPSLYCCNIFYVGCKCSYYRTPLLCFILFYFSSLPIAYVVKIFVTLLENIIIAVLQTYISLFKNFNSERVSALRKHSFASPILLFSF